MVLKLTFYLPKVLYVNYLLTSVTHVGLPLKTKQNKNLSISLTLDTDAPHRNFHAGPHAISSTHRDSHAGPHVIPPPHRNSQVGPYTWDFGIVALGFSMTIIPYFSFLRCDGWIPLLSL